MLRKADGTPYRLIGPNPILLTQRLWEEDDKPFVVHNFNYKDEVTYYRHTAAQPPSVSHPVSTNQLAFILPGTSTTINDPIYGDTKVYVSYGDKFQAEIITLHQNDIFAQLGSADNITPGSIIFIPQEKRWWKVMRSDTHDTGYILSCVPSPLTPSFD